MQPARGKGPMQAPSVHPPPPAPRRVYFIILRKAFTADKWLINSPQRPLNYSSPATEKTITALASGLGPAALPGWVGMGPARRAQPPQAGVTCPCRARQAPPLSTMLSAQPLPLHRHLGAGRSPSALAPATTPPRCGPEAEPCNGSSRRAAPGTRGLRSGSDASAVGLVPMLAGHRRCPPLGGRQGQRSRPGCIARLLVGKGKG